MDIDAEWSSYLTNTDFAKPAVPVVVPDIVAVFSELYISTKTKVLFLNQPIDINKIFWVIPIVDYWKTDSGVIKKQMKIVSKDQSE